MVIEQAILDFSKLSPAHEAFARKVFPLIIDLIRNTPKRRLLEISAQPDDKFLLLQLLLDQWHE